MMGDDPEAEQGSERGTKKAVRSLVHGTVERATAARAKLGERLKEGGEILQKTRTRAAAVSRTAGQRMKDAVEGTVTKARQASTKLGHVLKESGELLQLTRRAHKLRDEMDERYRAIGRRAFSLTKRARGEKPFTRFRQITDDLDTLERLERRYREVRTRLNEVRADLRRGGR